MCFLPIYFLETLAAFKILFTDLEISHDQVFYLFSPYYERVIFFQLIFWVWNSYQFLCIKVKGGQQPLFLRFFWSICLFPLHKISNNVAFSFIVCIFLIGLACTCWTKLNYGKSKHPYTLTFVGTPVCEAWCWLLVWGTWSSYHLTVYNPSPSSFKFMWGNKSSWYKNIHWSTGPYKIWSHSSNLFTISPCPSLGLGCQHEVIMSSQSYYTNSSDKLHCNPQHFILHSF